MRRAKTVVALGLLSAASAHAQSNNELAELKEQFLKLQSRIAEIERAQAARPPGPESVVNSPPLRADSGAVTAGTLPGSFKLPGSNTSISVGGFIKGVVIHSSRSPLAYSTADEATAPQLLPLSTAVDGTYRKNTWKAEAKESRLVVRTSTPSTMGTVTTLLEGDFFGAGGTETSTNGHGFRLRHAWATLGNLGVGQYWSNAVNLTSVPETIDFTAQIGTFGGVRQAGVRWTQAIDNGFWSVALENPESLVVTNGANSGAAAAPDNDKMPSLNGKIHFGLAGGEYEIAVLTTKTYTAPGPNERARSGYGLGISGNTPMFGRDQLIWAVNAGRNSGRHLSGLIADAVLIGSELQGVDTTAGYLSYKHFWTNSLRSSVAYSWVHAKYPAGLSAGTAAGLNKRLTTAHLNLIWTIVPKTDLGVEYIRATRETQAGIKGDLDRLLFMGKYNF